MAALLLLLPNGCPLVGLSWLLVCCSMSAQIDALSSKCSDMIALLERLSLAKKSDKSATEELSLLLLGLKSLYWSILTSLEAKKREAEVEKEVVDRLQLTLENLLYQQAHLRREIKSCRDISRNTPAVHKVEADLGEQVSMTSYCGEGEHAQRHAEAMAVLEKEMRVRQEKTAVLEALTAEHEQNLEVIDKKRKHLDDIPLKISALKGNSTLLELQQFFDESLKKGEDS